MQRQYKAIPPITQKISDKFFSKIIVGITDDGCWGWTGAPNSLGYGVIWIGPKSYYTHRVSYAIANGGIDDTLEVMHSCDNPICCNPSHLSQGTHRENIVDAVKKGRVSPPSLKGQDSGRSKLREHDVREIRRLVASGISQRQVARQYRVHNATVSLIIRRINWKHLD